MILDSFLQFDAALNLAQPAGTYNSTNTIDLGVTSGVPTSANGGGARDIGIGDDPAMKLMVLVTTTFVGGINVQASIQGAPDSGNATPGAWTTMLTGALVVTANLTQGTRLMDDDMPRPVPGQVLPRFLRMQYTTTGVFTAGVVESLLVLDRVDQIEQTNATLGSYPAGIYISN